jgi:hypothetical protein
MRCAALALLLAALCAAVALGQPPAAGEAAPSDSPANREQIDAALKLTTEAAGKYEIMLPGHDSPAKLIKEPVLRWSNPAVGEVHGNVFLWTVDTRPAAVGSLFKWFSPHKHTSHEFQSLAEGKLSAKYEGREVWTTKSAGVSFVPLAAEAPADTAQRRLAQMRQLARRFTGHLTTREGEQHELRLLTQPVYRYAAKGADVLDGGLFALVQGTDPDILFLLEARSDAKWHFAAARMQNCALAVQFDGREIWSAAQLEWSVAFDHSQPYTLFDTPGK